ncbi:MAG TPA: 6-phosphofructokinase [Candidatus Latescibacteria bacterium]|nr:6-phosphofructokinase [Candidatus Latescibacterota bacterium]
MKKIGILTGGGDAPGLNAVIRGATVKGIKEGYEVIGFRLGWAGTLNKDYQPLTLSDVEDIHRQGGTILGSSRTNPAKLEDGLQKVKNNLEELDIYALIASGGEDTLGVANKLYGLGVRVVGVPKTIDNDLSATDYTFGFDTAINRVMEALDRLHTTAKSHQRVMVVEIMGRHSGWMALYGGIAGGAHMILLPEEEFDYQDVCDLIKRRYDEGNKYAIIAVAEGSVCPQLEKEGQEAPRDDFGHVVFTKRKRGVAEILADKIEEVTGIETRQVVLGHLQRGGDPSAFDRVLATRLGVKAVEMIRDGEFGRMASIRGDQVVSVSLEEAVGRLKTVDEGRYELAKLFFG